MAFGKKKKAPEEEPTTGHIEASEGTPPPQEDKEATKRLKELVEAFSADYDGVIPQGSETAICNLLFAIYGELKQLNERQLNILAELQHVQETIEKVGE